ncbi:hypothetical protein Tco_0092300 [Tanacetum coccineum]
MEFNGGGVVKRWWWSSRAVVVEQPSGEAISERLEIDANSGFMVTYDSDNDIVEDGSSESGDESRKSDEEGSEYDEKAETTPIENKKLLGRILKEATSENSMKYMGKEIMTNMNARFKIDISYSQAWRAKCYALQLLRETPEDTS